MSRKKYCSLYGMEIQSRLKTQIEVLSTIITEAPNEGGSINKKGVKWSVFVKSDSAVLL